MYTCFDFEDVLELVEDVLELQLFFARLENSSVLRFVNFFSYALSRR